jgi:hypothetical protein
MILMAEATKKAAESKLKFGFAWTIQGGIRTAFFLDFLFWLFYSSCIEGSLAPFEKLNKSAPFPVGNSGGTTGSELVLNIYESRCLWRVFL